MAPPTTAAFLLARIGLRLAAALRRGTCLALLSLSVITPPALASGLAIQQVDNTQARIRIETQNRAESATLAYEGGTIAIDLRGATGTQETSLLIDRASRVTYTMTSAAAGTSADVALHAVIGNVSVLQTASAVGAKMSVDIAGGGFTTGGIDLRQSSPGATLALKMTAGGPGYTVKISQ